MFNSLMIVALTARAAEKNQYICTLHDGERLTIGDIEELAQEYIDENDLKDTDLSTEIDDFMTELCID
jgi:hypothetical protein